MVLIAESDDQELKIKIDPEEFPNWFIYISLTEFDFPYLLHPKILQFFRLITTNLFHDLPELHF